MRISPPAPHPSAAKRRPSWRPGGFKQRLDADLNDEYQKVTAVAHNAGDDLRAATGAVAYGADATEIDVRSAGGELFASHDDVAQLRDTVLLHLKERSPGYLRQPSCVLDEAAVAAGHRPDRRVCGRCASFNAPSPPRSSLLLIFKTRNLDRLRGARGLVDVIDGVSVRERLLSHGAQAWLKRRGLVTFAWTVNDERRMNELVGQGVDGGRGPRRRGVRRRRGLPTVACRTPRVQPG